MTQLTDPTNRPAPGLEREKVVSAALELLNEVGFDGLTVRRLADRLGVKASALYWHFESKQELIDQIAGKIIDEEFAQADPEKLLTATWQKLLNDMGHGMRRALQRHRDGALVLAKADLSNNKSFKGRDIVIGRLLDEGFSGRLALTALFTVGRFTLGCVFEEQADPHTREEREAYVRRHREIAKQFPALGRALQDFDPDKTDHSDYYFEQGLALIIAGVDARVRAQ